jgi:hypothetical protein
LIEARTMHAARSASRAARNGYIGLIVTGAALTFIAAVVVGLI